MAKIKVKAVSKKKAPVKPKFSKGKNVGLLTEKIVATVNRNKK